VSAYNVRAIPWEHGWELHVQDVGVTQCPTLAIAVQQVRDFIATMLNTDASAPTCICTWIDEGTTSPQPATPLRSNWSEGCSIIGHGGRPCGNKPLPSPQEGFPWP